MMEVARAVEQLVALLGGGAVGDAWVLVTEASSVGPNRLTGALAIGPVVDATATVRRMGRPRTQTG